MIGARVFAGALLTAAASAQADEPMFGYTNTTDLLPKSRWQIEQGITFRDSAGAGEFQRLESRTEVDVGLTDNLQGTLYLNASRMDARFSAPPEVRLSPLGEMDRSRIDSGAVELIWRLTSPYLRPAGSALLVDATVGHGPPVFGVKLIGQKNFRDDTIILAGNLRVDLGVREKPPGASLLPSRAVTPVEADLGLSYRFRPNWSVAGELRGRAKYEGRLLSLGRQDDAALYFGPTLHYGGERWFLTLTALRRIAARHSPSPATTLSSAVYALERTRWDGLRLRVGRTF